MKVLGSVLGKGSQKGPEKGGCYGFYSKKRVLRRVLRRGSEKGVSRRCLEPPLAEYAPLGLRPINVFLFDRMGRTYCDGWAEGAAPSNLH